MIDNTPHKNCIIILPKMITYFKDENTIWKKKIEK